MSTRLEQGRAKIEEILRARRKARSNRVLAPPPRYDDEFFEGVAWLDSLAGDPPPEGRWVLVIDESVTQNKKP